MKLLILSLVIATQSCASLQTYSSNVCCRANSSYSCTKLYSDLVGRGFEPTEAATRCCKSGVCHKN